MSTPKPRDGRSPFGTPGTSTPVGNSALAGRSRIPRYPLTPSRLGTATPRSASRFTPHRGASGAPSTPYGVRAMQRRAANTPGRDRRKSGRMQRETTFDILKNLGKALAPTSQPIRSSPQEKPPPKPEPEPLKDEIEELDNEPEIERPRLSLPLDDVDEEDEGSPEIPAPRLSLAFEEEDITVEYPRRATSDRDRARLSMISLGGPRLSENFGDSTRLESGSEGGDDTGLHDVGGPDETVISQGAFDRGGETEDLGRFNFDFNFPLPPPPGEGDQDEPLDDEGFELPAMDIQAEPGPMPDDDMDIRGGFDDDDEAGGGFGLELNLPHQASPESPGIAGGGLRDEDHVAPDPKQKQYSRHGIPVPKLPSGVVKKLAIQFAQGRARSKAKINKQTLAAIEQASSWYFEQVGEDLAAYSRHAGRKTIDESDVTTLMRRQRHISNSTTVFSLAQKHLPKELLQDMKLAMPP